MPVFTKEASEIFAPTDGLGNPRGADMSEVRTWGLEVEESLGTVLDGIDEELAGTSLTIDSDDAAKYIFCTSASSVTITLPATITEKMKVTIAQYGDGVVTIQGSGSAVLHHMNDQPGALQRSTAGKGAAIVCHMWKNTSGTAANWELIGAAQAL